VNTINIKDESENIGWYRMTDINEIDQVPFAVYAFTKPLTERPNKKTWAHEYANTVYIGKSGKTYSYADFNHNRKRKTGNNQIHTTSQVYERLKTHRENIVRTNLTIKRASSYQTFYEHFGYGKEIKNQVFCNILVPKRKLDENLIRSWISMIEGATIYRYSMLFGHVPICNIEHNTGVGDKMKVPDSYAQKKSSYLKEVNLEKYMQ
jgi:hypothetical protein